MARRDFLEKYTGKYINDYDKFLNFQKETYDPVLAEVDNRFGKDFIKNNSNGDGVPVAVVGLLNTGYNLAYVECGEKKPVVLDMDP